MPIYPGRSSSIAGRLAKLQADVIEFGDRDLAAVNCYPDLAAAVALTGGAGAWTYGAIVEVVPAATLNDDFQIVGVQVESVSVTDKYQVELYAGAGDDPIGTGRFNGAAVIPWSSGLIAGGSRIRAKLASASGGADVASVAILYRKATT